MALSWGQSFGEAGALIRLGLAFMWNGLMLAGVTYLTRTMITREIGLFAVGIYGAAFSISGLLLNHVLGAMGADYYPRLTSASSDHEAMVKLVNHQTEIGLLLAVPGLLGTLALAPWAIRIFYSGRFDPAVSLLPWFVLGCLGRVVSWPIGFVILAKGRAALFAGVQTLLNLIHIGLIWWGLTRLGLVGVALAFCALYLVATATVYLVARRLIRFSWSGETRRLLVRLLAAVLAVFAATHWLDLWPATLLGLVATLLVSLVCLRELVSRPGRQHRISRLLARVPVVSRVLPPASDA